MPRLGDIHQGCCCCERADAVRKDQTLEWPCSSEYVLMSDDTSLHIITAFMAGASTGYDWQPYAHDKSHPSPFQRRTCHSLTCHAAAPSHASLLPAVEAYIYGWASLWHKESPASRPHVWQTVQKATMTIADPKPA